jgi:branched-chain amino acid transport system ATP-binding protein
MSVMENLEMGAYGRAPRSQLAEDFDRAFALFPQLSNRRKQSGGTLSGGEQQMLAIARAIMARPQLVMLDEPSMGLAPLMVSQIFDIIAAIHEQGTTVLLVEQNAAQALARADRAYVLETGRVAKTGEAATLLADDSVRAAYLGVDSSN